MDDCGNQLYILGDRQYVFMCYLKVKYMAISTVKVVL